MTSLQRSLYPQTDKGFVETPFKVGTTCCAGCLDELEHKYGGLVIIYKRYDFLALVLVVALLFTIWKLIEWISENTDVFHDRRRTPRAIITIFAIFIGTSMFYLCLVYVFGLWMRL